MIEQTPFRQYKLYKDGESRPDLFTIRLNELERAWLEDCKKALQQPKDSSCIKMLAEIGMAKVLHDKETSMIIEAIFRNKSNNKRTGNEVL